MNPAARQINFRDHDVAWGLVAFPRFPFQHGRVVLAIFIMEERGVKANRGQVCRLGPGPRDLVRGHDIALSIKLAASHVLNVAESQPVFSGLLVV